MLSRWNIRPKVYNFLEKYGIVVAGVVIFLYYLWAAIDLFTDPNARRDFTGYFFQFSSVVLLWGLVYLGAKLFDYQRRRKEEQEKNNSIIQEFERRKMQLDLLDEVSELLNDTVNNPLSVISISASSIRERFEPDAEIRAYLDSIDGALRRMREVLADFKSYQTTKIVQSLQAIPSPKSVAKQEKMLSVGPTGDIHGG